MEDAACWLLTDACVTGSLIQPSPTCQIMMLSTMDWPLLYKLIIKTIFHTYATRISWSRESLSRLPSSNDSRLCQVGSLKLSRIDIKRISVAQVQVTPASKTGELRLTAEPEATLQIGSLPILSQCFPQTYYPYPPLPSTSIPPTIQFVWKFPYWTKGHPNCGPQLRQRLPAGPEVTLAATNPGHKDQSSKEKQRNKTLILQRQTQKLASRRIITGSPNM